MGKVTEAVRIVATAKEEIAIERGALQETKLVSTPKESFHHDGKKTIKASAPAGFAQLDITGIFMLAGAAASGATAGKSETAPFAGGEALKIPINRGRTQRHLGQYTVQDTFDIYLDASGRLAGIARSFYPTTSSLHYTLGYKFGDYRDTGGVLLPYRIEVHLKKHLSETIVVSEYQFNIAPDPALFTQGNVR
jgi:hypothetical protein